ncbi:hypothetical protein KC866_00700 [Patescibacteria group bacterium]|nr:hypothetical protein [Patescibacteria group bacterium]
MYAANVFISSEDKIFLREIDEKSSCNQELVLVQEYRPGSGAKRWPAFSVHSDNNLRILSETTTYGGSGSEGWKLLIAPLGWAEEIASRFVNERDCPDQEVAVGKDFFKKSEKKDPTLENLADSWGAKLKKS